MTSQKLQNLRDGTAMPAFGLGTWLSEPDEVYGAVRAALELGYRHIDCARAYGNEHEVGRAIDDAIAAGDTTRDDLWITSKLWNDAHRAEHVRPALQESLADLGVDNLDLYLIHWPIAFRRGVGFPDGPDDYMTLQEAPLEDTWAAMQQVKSAGLTRHIGVSNMGPERIAMLGKAGALPEVVQTECHPRLQQRALRDVCFDRGIVHTAYSPLGSPGRKNRADDEPALLDNPTILAIADEVDATAAQVLIAWALARDSVVIPKSVHRGRIAENIGALDVELGKDHMEQIGQLDSGYRLLDGQFFAGDDSPYNASEIWK